VLCDDFRGWLVSLIVCARYAHLWFQQHRIQCQSRLPPQCGNAASDHPRRSVCKCLDAVIAINEQLWFHDGHQISGLHTPIGRFA
jgi:hypothetical protein